MKKKSTNVSLETSLCSSCLLGLRDKTANLLVQRERREERRGRKKRTIGILKPVASELPEEEEAILC